MDLNLKDKVIIITGGTKGIGEAISQCVADEGGIPVFIGRTNSDGSKLLNKLNSEGKQGFFIQANLHTTENCKEIVDTVLNKFRNIHALINNAGRNDSIGLENGAPKKFANSIQENLNHYYDMAHFCLPALKKTKGNILNISSKVALTGQGGTSGYAASKGAQLALTREWASELLPYGIRVNAILPAEVYTPLYANWLNTFDDSKAKKKSIEKNIPLEKRMTTSLEIAQTAVFLISDKSSHTTGQFLSPDGGYLHLDRSLT